MALNGSRTAFTTPSNALRQCRCLSLRPSLRPFSSSRPLQQSEAPDAEPEKGPRPRWSYTPEGMKGPGFSINVAKDPQRKIWSVNEDPKLLDAMYNRFLGRDGDRLLPDEIKWLAVTHKSFDQGRRGFNTKLAYYGRQIIALEATRSILTTNILRGSLTPDPHNRVPFEHPALANVDKLSLRQPQDIIRKEKLAKLAVDIGLPEVIRWKPRLPENLDGSGLTVVLNTTLFAIVGAISLQHGAEVAGRVAREKILKRLIPA